MVEETRKDGPTPPSNVVPLIRRSDDIDKLAAELIARKPDIKSVLTIVATKDGAHSVYGTDEGDLADVLMAKAILGRLADELLKDQESDE